MSALCSSRHFSPPCVHTASAAATSAAPFRILCIHVMSQCNPASCKERWLKINLDLMDRKGFHGLFSGN